MSKLTWKIIGLAAVVAAGVQLATMGATSALVLPVPGQPTVSEAGQFDGQLLQVKQKKKSYKYQYRKKTSKHKYRKKTYKHKSTHHRYSRRYHGHRYTHRRHGYGYYYGGYWYASPWWRGPGVVITVPTHRYGSAHVRRCLNHYRSYNPRTDMFLGYDGRHHRCRY